MEARTSYYRPEHLSVAAARNVGICLLFPGKGKCGAKCFFINFNEPYE